MKMLNKQILKIVEKHKIINYNNILYTLLI